MKVEGARESAEMVRADGKVWKFYASVNRCRKPFKPKQLVCKHPDGNIVVEKNECIWY